MFRAGTGAASRDEASSAIPLRLEALPLPLQMADQAREAGHVGGGVPGVLPVDRVAAHRGVAPGVVVEVPVDFQFCGRQALVLGEAPQALVEVEQTAVQEGHGDPPGRRAPYHWGRAGMAEW